MVEDAQLLVVGKKTGRIIKLYRKDVVMATTTYVQAANPIWYIADNAGKPLGGGYLATYSSLNPQAIKFVFEDNQGAEPWSYVTIPNAPGNLQGILFDANGQQGPFYFQVNSANANDTYFLSAFDSAGNLVWTVENFSPTTGSGGGGGTTVVGARNLLINNVFWRNSPDTSLPSNVTFYKLAPGAHAGLSNNVTNAAGLYTGPDICFVKNNTAALDQLKFLPFTFGSSALVSGPVSDETPPLYLNYVCGNNPVGETVKCVQFPVTKGVSNLSGLQVGISIWARCNSGNTSLALNWLQYYGSGAGATVPTTTNIDTFTLTTSWAQYTVTTTVPSVSGNHLGSGGACGNDGLFLQVAYPLDAATNIDFIKPALYFGSVIPNAEYQVNDQIDSIITSARTGQIKQGYDTVADFGWLLMDDKTIGSAASGATSNGGLGASANSFPLYCLLWNNVSQPSTNTLCPVTGGLGASAVDDFLANKPLALQAILGRALASSGTGSLLTARALGAIVGTEAQSLATNNLPASMGGLSIEHTVAVSASGGPDIVRGISTIGGGVSTDIVIDVSGGGAGFNIMQPTSFMNFFIKL